MISDCLKSTIEEFGERQIKDPNGRHNLCTFEKSLYNRWLETRFDDAAGTSEVSEYECPGTERELDPDLARAGFVSIVEKFRTKRLQEDMLADNALKTFCQAAQQLEDDQAPASPRQSSGGSSQAIFQEYQCSVNQIARSVLHDIAKKQKEKHDRQCKRWDAICSRLKELAPP